MMSNNIKSAEALMSQGFAVIPLKKNQKHNTDKDILKRDYTLKDILNPIDNAFWIYMVATNTKSWKWC